MTMTRRRKAERPKRRKGESDALLTIWKREVRSYFHTPTGYVFMGVFLTISSAMFYMVILKQRSSDLPAFIGDMSYLWMLLSPVLTMKLLAEERQKKTDQLLLTSPSSLTGIVLGKYFAAITVLAMTVVLTFGYVVVVAAYGQIWMRELAVCYLGFVLQGCAFVALDLYISGCVASPMTAAILSFGANLLLWMMDLLADSIAVVQVTDVLSFLSLYSRNEPFLMGQLSFAGLIYDLAFICAFLLLTIDHLDQRRTRGN